MTALQKSPDAVGEEVKLVVVNDVSGGRADPAMLGLVAEAEVPYVCMHWRGHSTDMQSRATYADAETLRPIIATAREFLAEFDAKNAGSVR